MAPKKEKAQKMQLGEFLTDTSLGSWADEMDEVGMPSGPSGRSPYGGGDRGFGSGGGFGSSRFDDRSGFPPRESLPLPTRPPYTVHLGNLSFDATEGDVHDLFTGCEVDNVRIVEDKLDSKPKGFGYVEFKTLEGLKKALAISGQQFQGRNIRISVAEPQKDRDGPTRDFSDWSRKGPLPAAPQRNPSDRGGFGSDRGGFGSDRGGFGSRPERSFENVSEAGSERGGRRQYDQGDGKVRDFSNWERRGPPTPVTSNAAPARSFERPVSRDGPSLRRNSPAWGEGRSQDSGSRPPRREFVERPPIPERAPTAADVDTQWRARMKPDVPATSDASTPNARSPAQSNRGSSNPPSPAPAAAVPASRPKLNLAKRTVTEGGPEESATGGGDSKASPFGAAKPIDTATREKEVEEKRQQALAEKKEADEKAREEKRVADEKAKEERKAARDAELATRVANKGNPDAAPKSPAQANGTSKPAPRRRESGQNKPKQQHQQPDKDVHAAPPTVGKYSILQRQVDEDSPNAAEAGVEHAGANGVIGGDKETKPKEIVVDPKNDTTTINGVPTESSEPTAQALEDDGWSTVSKPARKGKGGGGAARALAS